MPVPKVVIVGRPNVGKSSLLNWLAGKRVSVVDPTAGVTRDRVTYLMHVDNRYFELVDTGGIGIVDSDDLSDDVERQINIAIDEATLIVFVVDADAGIVPLDQHVADRLRRVNKPILLVANKCDSPKLDHETGQFLKLATALLVVTSVKANRNRELLLGQIMQALPARDDSETEEGAELSANPELKLAIVGRRNVGKSTFINALAQAERMIVSKIPGTTRDSVDVRFELDGRAFIAIDTPGVRKRKSLANDIEYYGLVRAQRSIRRADVVLMFFDASQEISSVDKQLVHEIEEQFVPCIFVINKWDLGRSEDMTTAAWSKYLLDEFPAMRYPPVAFITAREEVNVKKLINLAQSVAKQARMRIPTSQLNAVIREAVLANRPPMRAGKQPKIFYGTQVATEPPTIVLKCNFPRLFDKSWHRYLLTTFRDRLPIQEVPIKLYFRARARGDDTTRGIDELNEAELLTLSETDEPGGELIDDAPGDDAWGAGHDDQA